jgi:hypothetical protein
MLQRSARIGMLQELLGRERHNNNNNLSRVSRAETDSRQQMSSSR